MKNRELLAVLFFVLGLGCAPGPPAPDWFESKRAKDNFYPGLQLELAEAAGNGNVSQIENLIKMGADPNRPGQHGATLLMWALLKRNKSGFLKLLEFGADPNFVSDPISEYDRGRSVMMMAAACEDPEFLRMALTHKGSPNAVGHIPGRTIIFEAVFNEHVENIKIISSFGGDLNHQDKFGDTPMIRAVLASRYDIVYLLMELGADPGLRAKKGGNVADLIEMFHSRAAYAFPDRSQKEWYRKVVQELKRRGYLKNID